MASFSSSAAPPSLSTNFARIGHAAQQMFPGVLQELMTIKEPPHRLSHDVNSNWYLKNKLRPDEWLLINDVTTKGYTDFDIPFIYKLVRNLKLLSPPTQGWDHSTAPSPTDLKAGDDLERIRRFRNEILHRGNAQVTDTDFSHFFTQFKEIAGRLETYLGKQTGEFVDKFINLETCCIDEETKNVYIKRLYDLKKSDDDCKKRLEILEEDMGSLKEKDFQLIYKRVEELESTQDEVVPKNILEQCARRLKQWKEDDQTFVDREAGKKVMESILTKSCITIVGNSGTGKTFLSRHIALKMKDQGYSIIPCSIPDNIIQWFKPGRKTVFVFDDVCGRYTLNQHIFNDWTQRLDHIESLIKDTCCKIMSTCRLDVYKDEKFSSLSIFKMCYINLSSFECKLNSAENVALTKMYIKENIDEVNELSEKFDCFPLLCSLYQKQNLHNRVCLRSFFDNPFNFFKTELDNLYNEGDDGKMKYCGLVLCVMFNNTIKEENLSYNDKELAVVIENLLVECELNKGTSVKRLKKFLETMEGTYVVKEDNTYKIVHDKMFDFLAKYFGESMLQLFIDHANIDFIRERFLLETKHKVEKDIEFTIKIPANQLNRYIYRLQKDWEDGHVDSVFVNRNMTLSAFTEKFIYHLNTLEQSKQDKLACTKDTQSQDIALAGSCYIGSVDLVKWLISKNSIVNHCRQDSYFPLFWACQNGHVTVVKELLRHSADVDKSNHDGWSPMLIACQNGHVRVVQELLKHSPNVIKSKNNDGVSPLWTASEKGHVSVVQSLLQHGAKVNACNDKDMSPLHIASKHGHEDIVKELIQHSAEVNKCTYMYVSPLYIASQYGHANIVKELLQNSADVNLCSKTGNTSFKIACLNNRIAVVNELLQSNDIDINCCDHDGCSSLYWASQQGHVDIVKILVQHSVDVNKPSKNGTSPFKIACLHNRIKVIKELAQCNDIDIDFCDNNGQSPLYSASQQGHLDIVKQLLHQSAHVNNCDRQGVSPLWIASRNGHCNVLKVLLKHSADVNQCKNGDISPLQIACCYNNIDVVTQILQCDCVNIDHCDSDECSSLYSASKLGYADIVKELLKYSAKINKCNKDGISPLQISCNNNIIGVVNVLLQSADVDINICDDKGCSSLFVASNEGHIELVKLLIKHSADVNLCKNNGVSPIWQASENGHIDVVKELLKHSAKVNNCNIDGVSPLMIASQNGHVNVVNELLQYPVHVNQCSRDGMHSLLKACFHNIIDVVQILLQCNNVDINLCDNNGCSSLYWASYCGNTNVVKLLLQYSADVNKCTKDGNHPLMIACLNNNIEVVNVFLQRNDVDIDICDNNGCSSLYWASYCGNTNVVKLLLQYSADVNKCAKDGTHPLKIACYNNSIEVVNVFLQRDDVDIDLCDNYGYSSLYWASRRGHADVVKELLRHSVDVNKSGNNGESPLLIACQYGLIDVIKQLLQNYADVNKCDINGKNPFSVARKHKHKEVESLLLEKGTNQN